MTATAAVTVAVQSELMMDYQMTTPYADPTPTLAVAPVSTDQVAFYTVTSSGGVAQVAPDSSSDTGWVVADLGFGEGTAIGVAAYLDTDLSTVVFAATTGGLYSARSTQAWAWGPVDLGQPAGWSVGGVRTQQCAWQGLAPVMAIAAEHAFMPVQSTLYGQVSGETVYTADDSYPSAYTDFSPGPVLLPGQSAPQPGAFVSEPGAEGGPSYPAGIRCTASGGLTSAFLEGAFTGLATTVNNSGWLEAFVIDALDGYSLNYLSPAGSTFAEVPIAQTPGDGGQQVTSYPIGSLAAVTDGQGVMHVIACTTDGTLLHVRQSQDAETGWDPAAPIAGLGCPAELAAVADHDGDVHVFARADRSGQVSYLRLSVATGEWSVETVSADVPHQDYVQQIATYSATLSVYQAGGGVGCGLAFTVTAKDPVTVQIDGSEAALADGIEYSGVTGPDGQVVIVSPTTSLSMPALYAWFEGMPVGDRVAVHLSGPVEAAVKDVTTGTELLQQPTAYSNKLEYTTGTVLSSEVTQAEADNAADSIDAVMALTKHKAAADDRLHPSTRPHAARYLADWDGTPADQIDRRGRPDQYFRLNFSGAGPLFERLDARGAAAARAELEAAGSWLPDISWGDVFGAVADVAGTVTSVVVQAAGAVIDATISMVVDGVSYVWNAVVTGVGQLLDLVQTIFARLAAGFWALVGWLGWVFNWNDILLTHQAASYFVTNAAAWAKYGLASVQGQIGAGIAGLQASISDAVSAYLATQVPPGSTLASMMASQPAPPAGTDTSGDPRNVFGRGLRTNGNSAAITASSTPPSPQEQSDGQELLSQAGQYASAALAAPELQALTSMAEPTQGNPAGILDQPMTKVIQAVADGATWGLGLLQTGADAMFDLAGGTIDGMTSLLTETWDIPLVTDIYAWVTNGSDLSALDVVCLLLAVPATITYKAIFGETPIPDQDTLDAVMAAYPPPPADAGASPLSGVIPAPDPTALEIGGRLGNVLTGLSYIASGFLEARVDVALAIWTEVEGGPEVPRCPGGWQNLWWVVKPGAMWERLFVLTEFLTSAFSVVPLIPNWTLDCGTTDGQAVWLWIIGNIQWVLDLVSLLAQGSIIEELWRGGGPLVIAVLGLVQITWQIIIWCRLGSKGWAGSLAGVLTAVPNLCKPLMSPQATWSASGIPVCALAEAALDIAFNFIGGIFYVLAGTHVSQPA